MCAVISHTRPRSMPPATVRESLSRGPRLALASIARLFSSISAAARARAPAALYAVAASAGPVGGRVGTRPRPDSAYEKPTTRSFGTCRRTPSRRPAPHRAASRRIATFRSRLLQIPVRSSEPALRPNRLTLSKPRLSARTRK